MKVSFNQLTQASRTSIIVEINEQFLESLNMGSCIGVDHAFLGIIGDKCHNIMAPQERRSISAKSSLGFITPDKRFLCPALVRTRGT